MALRGNTRRQVLMEIRRLPPEIIEKIFLHLDTQTLASCALADSQLADIINSSHFLDEYCRTSLSCSWITATDVYNASIAVPYEFWFWVYTTMKLENTDQTNLIFHNKHLTKIGTFRHMFIMWLLCGLRPSFLYSHTLMYELYPLPETVDQVFKQTFRPDASVNNVLVKIFLALPEIMELSCSNLELLKMQTGFCSSLHMDIVCNDGIQPKLPLDFMTLFSIEIISSALFGKNPALLILIGSEKWILWLGFLNISFDHNETSIVENLFCKYFNNEDSISDIQQLARSAVQDLRSFVYSLQNGSPCPIISAEHPDMATQTIFLAQEHHRSLQQKFSLVLDKHCSHLIKSLTSKSKTISDIKDAIMKDFNIKLCENTQINYYIRNLLMVEKNRNSTIQHLGFVIYKCILECITNLFRNEIYYCVEDSFCHSFLCGCLGPTLKNLDSVSIEDKIEKCLAEKMKDGLYPPQMWPSHILSAACQVVPVLTEVLELDILMITSMKCVIPKLVELKTNQTLLNAGLVLTNRHPSKPRCPPLLNQVKLWTVENLS